MNYEHFMKLQWVDLQLREKERLLGTVPQKLARVTPGVWLLPGDLVCWLIWLCFVLLLLGIAEQMVVTSLRGDVAALDESLYPSSITVLQSIAWWIDQTAQTFNNKYSKWLQESSWTTRDCRVKSKKQIVVTQVRQCCYEQASRAWLRPWFSIKNSVILVSI